MKMLLRLPIVYHITSDGVVLQNKKVVEQLKVLDNEVKLRILALLADTGAKSITDISRILNLNFSTAHKYLEQLEHASFVRSQQETGNRLKRMFYIQNFMINITPRNISNIVRGGEMSLGDEQYGKFHIITHSGKLERFDKYKFAKLYLDAGVPKNTIEIVFDSIKNQIYDGITWSELENLFINSLKERTELVWSVVNKIHKDKLHEKTFANILALRDPEAIKMHESGDIFIKNLSKPKLLNFIHDIRGISLHGIKKRPKTLKELFDQILYVVSVVDSRGISKYHALPSFNYLIAPLVREKLDAKELHAFLVELNKYNVDINIELSLPKFAKEIPIEYFTKDNYYAEFSDIAQDIAQELGKLFASQSFENLRLIAKRNNDQDQYEYPALVVDNVPDAHYVSDTKGLTAWKGWLMSTRIGEAQKISINLPKILMGCNGDVHSLIKRLEAVVSKVIDIHTHIAGELLGSFLNSSIIFESELSKRWNYMYTNEFIYSISLYGLGSFDQKDQIAIAKSVASMVKKVRSTKSVRLVMKSEVEQLIKTRFSSINKKPCSEELDSEVKSFFDGGIV
jgi:DNA-binding transcriptional ArsR family regulator